jgi:endonuclease III
VIAQKRRKKVTAELVSQAVGKYGQLKNRKARPPLNQLVLSVFYHVTSVRRATRALNELKRAFVDWNEVRVSHPVEVASALSSSPWALEGAERLVWLLREIYDVHSSANLDFLNELTPTQARTCLKKLTSVRRDLADEVLLLSLRVPVLPISPAAARMCHRLGLLEDDRPTVKNQRALSRAFGEGYFAPLHLFFCDVAEKVCLPEEPLCDECPVCGFCTSHG